MTPRRNTFVSSAHDVPPPRTPPGEKATLLGLLDYLRDRVVAKIDGVPEPAVRAAGVESGTNLLGLVKHLGYAEQNQFLHQEPDSWPATFVADDDETVDAMVAAYRAAIERSNAVVAAAESLDDPIGTQRNSPPLRWVLAHMIEETGRHAGQMDILRERIDGVTGR